MATITKRMTKSGPSYRIQVKMKDKGSGKLNVYSTTWRPPAGLTQKQMEREVVIYADKYESERMYCWVDSASCVRFRQTDIPLHRQDSMCLSVHHRCRCRI